MRRQTEMLLAALGLLALLAGCSGEGVVPALPPAETPSPEPDPVVWLTPAPTPQPDPEPSPAPADRPSSAPEEPPAPPASQAPAAPPAEFTPSPEAPDPDPPAPELPAGPSDGEVLDAYRRAAEAYGWFEMATLPENPEDVREVEGRTYCRVDSDQFASLADLRGYLRSLFSDEIVDALLPAGGTQYLDLDGGLYVMPGGRGSNLYLGEERQEVLRESESRCLVQVTVDQVDPEQDFAVTGQEVHTFSYEKVGDKWIFTSFSLFR